VFLQDLAQYWWTVLVAFVRGLIVVLDWCFTIDLLRSRAMSGVARALRAAQATFTQPWLALVLAIAAVIAMYHGLIRRRVAETVGEALLMLAMMVAGLWVIMNPSGTVGVLGAWANEASLGTLAATVAAPPEHPYRTLAESNREVFDAVIATPWCYMEFGEVSWCGDPERLDPRLRAAALRIAGEPEHAPGASAELLRGARTNGELFLALPANEAARNSINEGWSLFHVLCGGGEQPCHGPTAGEADFRNQSGTWPRVIGLVFISFGVLGMLLLLGFIGLRLLGAAIMGLIYLLVTPAAVLAPALGESGRAAFRTWATRLLGAVISKLVFAFLLGAVLTAERTLLSVRLFGWWTQWLLASSVWWIAWWHRHKALDFASGERGGRGGQRTPIARRAREVLGTARQVSENLAWARRRLARPAPSVRPASKRPPVAPERANAVMDGQVKRSLEQEHRDACATARAAPEIRDRLADKRAQLRRVKRGREEALAGGDTRRAIALGDRARRVEGEISSEQRALSTSVRVAGDGRQVRNMTGDVYSRGQALEHQRFLDAQAALPSTVQRRVHGAEGKGRDYAGLASLVGYGRRDFEQLDPPRERMARLEIDRELATRREMAGAAMAGVDANRSAGGHGRGTGKARDRDLGGALHPERRGSPSAPEDVSGDGSRAGARKYEDAAGHAARQRRASSPVMDDARAVAARRKRQLGRDRP